jgi:hypothetical protein
MANLALLELYSKENKNIEVLECLDVLQEVDPVRRNYWNYRKMQL